jgi:hypothetical protein
MQTDQSSNDIRQVLNSIRRERESKTINGAGLPKLKPYDGKIIGDAELFVKRFKRLALVSGWSKEHELQNFSLYLEGRAARVYEKMGEADKINQDTLYKKFVDLIAPTAQQSMTEFENRKPKKGETTREFAEGLEDLFDRALPNASSKVRETMLRKQFRQHIPKGLQALVDFAGYGLDWNEVVERVSIRKPYLNSDSSSETDDSDAEIDVGYSTFKRMWKRERNKTADKLVEPRPKHVKSASAEFSKERNLYENKNKIKCYYCAKPGHIQRDCYQYLRSKAQESMNIPRDRSEVSKKIILESDNQK